MGYPLCERITELNSSFHHSAHKAINVDGGWIRNCIVSSLDLDKGRVPPCQYTTEHYQDRLHGCKLKSDQCYLVRGPHKKLNTSPDVLFLTPLWDTYKINIQFHGQECLSCDGYILLPNILSVHESFNFDKPDGWTIYDLIPNLQFRQ